MQQLFIQFINYVWYLLRVSALHCHPQGAFLVPSERCPIEEQSIEYCGWTWCAPRTTSLDTTRPSTIFVGFSCIPLNAELNPICHLLALVGGATIVIVSRLRVNFLTTVLNEYVYCVVIVHCWGSICGRHRVFFSSPPCPDWLWIIFLAKGILRNFFQGGGST